MARAETGTEPHRFSVSLLKDKGMSLSRDVTLSRRWTLVVAALFAALNAPMLAQTSCGSAWNEGWEHEGQRGVLSTAVFDDGTGPALYAGGLYIGTPNVAGSLWRWDGVDWSAVPGRPLGTVAAVVTFDDGSGPALYVGGAFATAGGQTVNNVARWNGQSWSPLAQGLTAGTGFATVRALCVHDDGTGPALYAGGYFTSNGSTTVNGVARWTGGQWAPLSTGVQGYFGSVFALTSYAGTGTNRLYAGGTFSIAGGQAASRIASWDGANWSAVGSGMIGAYGDMVRSLTTFDPGSGEVLVIGGLFTSAGGTAVSNIAQWDGSQFSALGAGVAGLQTAAPEVGGVYAMTRYAEGGVERLFVAGHFTSAGGQPSRFLARWDGQSWSPVGGGLTYSTTIEALGVWGSPTAELYVFSQTLRIDAVGASGAARWNGTRWAMLGRAFDSPIDIVAQLDTGAGPRIVAAVHDYMPSVTPQEAWVTARNAEGWEKISDNVLSPPGAYVAQFKTLASFDAGAGPELYGGGSFQLAGAAPATTNFAKLVGTTWTSIGSVDGSVNASIVFDDGTGPALYIGGAFGVAGGVTAPRVARWNGSTWTSVGCGLGPAGSTVNAFAVMDDGTGPSLYAAGTFAHECAGGTTLDRVARWNGSAWVPVGAGLPTLWAGHPPVVNALTVHDAGTGPRLYAGGHFESQSGLGVSLVWSFDGTQWSPTPPVGSPYAGANPYRVLTLASYDDGAGAKLYAGGDGFSVFGAGRSVAVLGSSGWQGVDGGLATPNGAALPVVRRLAPIDDGFGGALYAAGSFHYAGATRSYGMARFGPSSGNGVCLGAAATGNVAAQAGGPFDVLTINGSSGGSGRRVVVPLNQPITIAVDAPPTSPTPAAFLIFGFIGQPLPGDAFPLPAGLGIMAFPPALLFPADPRLFTFADSSGLCGCALVGAALTPFTYTHAPGLGYPERVGLQGLISDPTKTLGWSVTNGVLLDVGP